MDRSAVVSIEQIEREAWLDLFSVAPAQFVNDWGAQSARPPAAAVFGLREEPLVELNRAVGIGVEQQPSKGELDRVTAWLRTHGNSAWALQIAPVACSEVLQRWMEHSGLMADGGVVTLTAARRIKANLGAGHAQAAMLAADFHSAMALRRCRRVAGAEPLERGGTKRLRTAEKTLANRCRYLGDRKPCITRSRRRNGRCEFSARLLSPLCERCSTSGMS
jgi:hypothetical protein